MGRDSLPSAQRGVAISTAEGDSRLRERQNTTPVAALPGRNKWVVLATVGLGTFLSVLDASVVNVSLPVITRELNTDLTTIRGW